MNFQIDAIDCKLFGAGLFLSLMFGAGPVFVVTRYEVCDVYNGCRVMSRDEMYLCDWL